jgi:hypothetical protein
MVKQITRYQTDDGEMFDTAEAAKVHEDTIAFRALLGLDESDLSCALQRLKGFEHISDALELAGGRVAKLRRESGDLRRRAKGEEPQTVQEPAPVEAVEEALRAIGHTLEEAADREAAERDADEFPL